MASPLPQPSVYVVDDDDAVRDSLDLYLTLKGMKVTIFGSAQELLDHSDGAPQIYVVDVNMPGINGIALLETLRERGHAEPVVLITGLGDPEIRAKAAACWSDGVFRQAD